MPTLPASRRRPGSTAALALAAVGLAVLSGCDGTERFAAAPQRLADTGLYADPVARTIAAGLVPFAPQYPLWTDGAQKQRWIALPDGAAVDASDADRWQFPAGTRLWKQFTFATGVETRFMARRSDGSWLYATYVRTADGRDDLLAPANGIVGFCATEGTARHDVPGVADCRSCHEGAAVPVLGFSALQLSADRDPLAPHADRNAPGPDLAQLVANGVVRGLPAAHVATAPRIAARSPVERAALGYLHGNCSSCHNGDGPLARLGLRFDYPLAAAAQGTSAPALATLIGVASGFTRGGARLRVAPGDPEASVLWLRLRATDPLTQMPPFGRHLADPDAVQLFDRWIRSDLAASPAAVAPSPSPFPSPTTHFSKQ